MKDYSPVLNCETCGGALIFSDGGLSAKCPYCGNEYAFREEKSQALSLALNRAAAYRAKGDFDAAINEYKSVLADYPQDAEAHWGLALSIYGIEYVEDSRTKKLIPTCRRTVRQSIFDNPDYVQAIDNADPAQAQAYAAKAKVIDRLQKDIMRRMDEEQDYDVFICFRSADENGLPTRERTIARRIYDELTRRGIKTFFSEVTLKDRIGDDYEPIIYKALYSCKFFILVAVSEQNINSPWVKNEWSRYRDRMAEEGLTGACCAVYEGMSLADFPAFMRSVQGVNLAKYPAGGYEIELADNLESRFKSKKKELRTGILRKNAEGVEPLLEEGYILLEDGEFVKAAAEFSRALSLDQRCGDAWLGALLADVEVRKFESGKKFTQELSNRLWASASSAEECTQRLAANGRIIYSLNSSNFANAVKYSKYSVASALENAKTQVTELAKKCNQALNLCMEQLQAQPQEAAEQNEVQAESADNPSIGAAIAGAAAGSIIGDLYAASRIRRPPRGPRGGPHGGPRR
ncbi:MAG: TIR domain-containing protein [Clostridia bacterium]|nr:TIR domain-containing protein [Clostridia bacterium]